ncbi:hypothetical protein UFOVP166_35 [uncultured Caudovirales phage]|uniref:Uncharacterized protein n=1 Tax=uncultured Caudovirales phage TaxID=2100421 RepID=A0A6J7WA04_9CAUD|nr:hypothetical protein UFOVP166_35 [uncultured Caudovirales phage]
MRIHPDIEKAMKATGLPWSVEVGGRHLKLRLNGRFVGICPKGRITDGPGHATKNIVAQIKRAAITEKEADHGRDPATD